LFHQYQNFDISFISVLQCYIYDMFIISDINNLSRLDN